jgi:hypothetical protein
MSDGVINSAPLSAAKRMAGQASDSDKAIFRPS